MQKANKHMTRCLTLSVIKKIQNTNTMRYCSIPIRMATIKLITINIGKDIWQLKLSYIAGRDIKWSNNFRELFGSLL